MPHNIRFWDCWDTNGFIGSSSLITIICPVWECYIFIFWEWFFVYLMNIVYFMYVYMFHLNGGLNYITFLYTINKLLHLEAWNLILIQTFRHSNHNPKLNHSDQWYLNYHPSCSMICSIGCFLNTSEFSLNFANALHCS